MVWESPITATIQAMGLMVNQFYNRFSSITMCAFSVVASSLVRAAFLVGPMLRFPLVYS